MSDLRKTSTFQDANMISKEIERLKAEIMTIKLKGGERALRMKVSHVRRIEEIDKRIKDLMFRRNQVVRTVQRNPNPPPKPGTSMNQLSIVFLFAQTKKSIHI